MRIGGPRAKELEAQLTEEAGKQISITIFLSQCPKALVVDIYFYSWLNAG
jgi:hypothetical protein